MGGAHSVISFHLFTRQFPSTGHNQDNTFGDDISNIANSEVSLTNRIVADLFIIDSNVGAKLPMFHRPPSVCTPRTSWPNKYADCGETRRSPLCYGNLCDAADHLAMYCPGGAEAETER